MNSLSVVRSEVEVPDGDDHIRLRRFRRGAAKSSPEFVFASPAMQRVMAQVAKAARTDIPITLIGETGVGKELVAQKIHELSPRREQPWVSVNCASIPVTLAESLLFGHIRGAFTGAVSSHAGFFERADRGTLFLDELADLSSDIQAKLLRVIEGQSYSRVGSTQEASVNVRLVLAVNEPLVELVRKERFREDLFYRVGMFPVVIPPLRERKEDLEILVPHFLAHLDRAIAVAQETWAIIRAYHWPGNVRQLMNVLKRASILAEGEEIQPDDLPEDVRQC